MSLTVERGTLDRTRFFIGGDWVDPLDKQTHQQTEAATGAVIGVAALAGAAAPRGEPSTVGRGDEPQPPSVPLSCGGSRMPWRPEAATQPPWSAGRTACPSAFPSR
jgi:hypothetical protein